MWWPTSSAALITNVDGKKITYYKTKVDPDAKGGGKGGGKGGFGGKAMVKDGDAVKATVPDKAKIAKGAFDMDTKTFKAGDDIEGGLVRGHVQECHRGEGPQRSHHHRG